MSNVTYNWLVTIRKGGKRTLTSQVGQDVLGAISSALRYNPDIHVTDILEIRQTED